MSRGMVSFLAGMGAGYIKAKDKALEQERQAKDDAWKEEQRGRQRSEWQAADKLNADLKDAAAPVQIQEGSGGFVKPDTMDNRDVGLPENAGQPSAGLMQGQFKVADQSFADRAAADKAAGDANSTTGIAARTAAAYRANGKVSEAMGMENAVMEQKAKKLGLEVAELKFADDQFNRQLGETFANSPDWTQAAAQVLTKTQVGSLAGVNVQAVPSQDGKKVEFVGQGQDGKQKVLATFDNSDAGKAQFLQRVMRAPVETKIGWIVEEAKEKQAQANADRAFDLQKDQFDLNKRETENNMQYRNRMLAIQQAQEGRASAQHRATMEDAKIPPAVKLNAQALAEQIKSVDAALNKSMAEGMFDPANPGSQKLQEQRAALSIQYRRLLDPYIPAAKGATADPLGLSSSEPAAAPAAPAGPTTKAAQKQPATYDPALQTVVNAMSPKKPQPTGPGTVGYMQQVIQQNKAITGRN